MPEQRLAVGLAFSEDGRRLAASRVSALLAALFAPSAARNVPLGFVVFAPAADDGPVSRRTHLNANHGPEQRFPVLRQAWKSGLRVAPVPNTPALAKHFALPARSQAAWPRRKPEPERRARAAASTRQAARRGYRRGTFPRWELGIRTGTRPGRRGADWRRAPDGGTSRIARYGRSTAIALTAAIPGYDNAEYPVRTDALARGSPAIAFPPSCSGCIPRRFFTLRYHPLQRPAATQGLSHFGGYSARSSVFPPHCPAIKKNCNAYASSSSRHFLSFLWASKRRSRTL